MASRPLSDSRPSTCAPANQVRFHEAFRSGAGRGEWWDIVVGPTGRRVGVGQGANGDDVGIVRRHADGHRIRAAVAGRHHHDQAGLPGAHHGLVERIIPVVGLRRGAQRQVDHPDVVFALVIQCPLDAGDDVRVAPTAVLVEHVHRNDDGIGVTPLDWPWALRR